MAKTRDIENEAIEHEPTFDEGAFESDQEEFLNDSDAVVDDNQTDYYEYGDKKHGVRADIPATVPRGSHGRHSRAGTSQQYMDAHQRRSRRMRWTLRLVALLLLGCIAALGYFGWQLLQESRSVAIQQSSQTMPEASQAADTEEAAQETTTATVQKASVPKLISVMGKTLQEAQETIGLGATVSNDAKVDEKDNPVKQRQTLVLTEEPTDTRQGSPKVYLGENGEGKVIQAGYTVPTTRLGYGALSFTDAVENEHIVEQTLRDIGLSVEDGSATLPENEEYATYGPDGITLAKEQCSFAGTAKVEDKTYEWSSVLLYDYTAANASGNLADTVRTITVYVDAA